MYYLGEEERRLLLRRYLPQVRDVGVSEEVRGWNWAAPPLLAVYSAPLGVSEVASRECPSGRDLYLRRVLGEKGLPSQELIDSGFYHAVVASVLLRAKQQIYRDGVDCLRALESLTQADLPPGAGEVSDNARRNGTLLWRYETQRIVTRAAEVLARFPEAGVDALAAAIVPVTIEQQVDGTFLGLSRSVRIDAVHLNEPMVADLHFGQRKNFHRIGLAGYALVLESLLEQPINLGYLVYVDFRDGHVVVEREFHVLGDELRQWFTDERDEKSRLVELELDPGLADHCPESCPHWTTCYSA
ncbi:MAG: type I-A CRISPR-associated protein Cas4/Csa1 [Dehalococcoidia bacterium]